MLCKFNPNLNILQNAKSPDEVAQYLLNSGKVTQAQVNQARQMWQNPNVQQQINNMK
jgi:hypothetical protein